MEDIETESYGISGKGEFKYCPLCGAKTDKEEVSVGRHKTNQKVTCPTHGELFIRWT